MAFKMNFFKKSRLKYIYLELMYLVKESLAIFEDGVFCNSPSKKSNGCLDFPTCDGVSLVKNSS